MSKGMRTVVLALMLAIGLNSGNMAKADLIPVDDAVFGIGSITRDTGTGLDWLDLPFTGGRSFNDISTRFGVGGEFEGFHHASSADVIRFFINAGIPDINGSNFNPANTVPVLALFDVWGTLLVTSTFIKSQAIVADVTGDGSRIVSGLTWFGGPPELGAIARSNPNTVTGDDTTDISLGHALIRGEGIPPNLIVPEPATSVLLLSGLVMVGLAKRKLASGKRRSSRL